VVLSQISDAAAAEVRARVPDDARADFDARLAEAR
jgi:hypothetical protein